MLNIKLKKTINYKVGSLQSAVGKLKTGLFILILHIYS